MSEEEVGGIWVNGETGEIVPIGTEGAVLIPDDDLPVETPGIERDEDWLGDWLTKHFCRIESERQQLIRNQAIRLARLSAREKYLEWKYASRMAAVVEKLRQGKKKSVVFAYGRAGTQTVNRIRLLRPDEEVIAWAKEHAQDAVKVTESIRKSKLPETCPMAERVKEEEFYMYRATK